MEIEIEKDLSIYLAAQKAVQEAKRYGQNITFDFNEINIEATPHSNPDDLAIIYNLKAWIRRMENNS